MNWRETQNGIGGKIWRETIYMKGYGGCYKYEKTFIDLLINYNFYWSNTWNRIKIVGIGLKNLRFIYRILAGNGDRILFCFTTD